MTLGKEGLVYSTIGWTHQNRFSPLIRVVGTALATIRESIAILKRDRWDLKSPGWAGKSWESRVSRVQSGRHTVGTLDDNDLGLKASRPNGRVDDEF